MEIRFMSSQVTAKEYWTKKGDIDLYIYRKHEGASDGKPVLFLVHGSSLSARPGYDIQVPGRGTDYSMMDHCAHAGFDVWTMDHEGYGRSSRSQRNSNVAMAVEDLDAAMEVVARETGRTRAHFYGQSGGALRAALYAQLRPHKVDKLILDAFVWTGEGSPTLIKRREHLDKWRASHIRPIDNSFMHSIFTRDRPGTSEMIVADVVAEEELKFGSTMPTGTYLDMSAHLPLVDPEKIACSVQIIRGEHDGIATVQDLLAFFEKLQNPDKQFTVLPGSAHIAQFGLNFPRFYHVLFGFLKMPARVDKGGSQTHPDL
jgi:pimeloyl-ACP methyl ester carboxylesterase